LTKLQEAQPWQRGAEKRKVVILGDTVDSRPIAPLALNADVLAHEATFSQVCKLANILLAGQPVYRTL
jgi:ribonuclease BN (tRNA processing enzyme)